MTRRRYRYDPELREVVEVGADWTDAEARAATPTEELIYGGLRATDGTPINTRRRHREYMKQNGLALTSDYTESHAKAAAQREAFFAGRHSHPGLKESIGRAYDAVKRKKR